MNETNGHFNAASPPTKKMASKSEQRPAKARWKPPSAEEFLLLKNSSQGNLPMVQRLRGRGVSVNCSDESGATPLMFASRNGHSGVVRELLEARAAVNAVDNGGFPALFFAGDGSHLEVAELLLTAGADPNIQENELGNACLHQLLVLEKETPELVAMAALLLRFGANANLKNKRGALPLYCCGQNGHTEAGKLLLEAGANVNLPSKTGGTPAFMASQEGRHDFLELLVANGADCNICDEDDLSPLNIASQKGHLACVKVLLRAKAAVNHRAKPENGTLALHSAAGHGHCEIVQELLANDADVKLADVNGVTAMHFAAHEGHSAVLRSLIAAGASANVQNKVYIFHYLVLSSQQFGATPLHLAAFKQQDEAITVLVQECGARFHTLDSFGERALDWAPLGSTTRALLTDMEATGADEIVLTKRAIDRPPRSASAAASAETVASATPQLSEASSIKEILSALKSCPAVPPDEVASCLEKPDLVKLARQYGLLSVSEPAAAADAAGDVAAEESGNGTKMCDQCRAKAGKSVCTGCRGARYCSVECQRVAWKGGHKAVCLPKK